jgi:NAD(P)-dependent dehydrogenase (short-subunit alcohol dehydrogenase family)
LAKDLLFSLLDQLDFEQGCLSTKVALVTGAGGGIGYQAARSLLWLGASVIIAEIDRESGRQAKKTLSAEFGKSRVKFYQTDIGSQKNVHKLVRKSSRFFNHVDILINNATIAPLGKVVDTPITTWDASYRVNLRGPVMLIQHILPEMLKRSDGVIINVSSTGTAFMGAYETFKSAQVHLTETLDAELEGSDVIALTVGPGLVPTLTATRAIEQLAQKMGLSLDNFYAINKNAILSVEEAGAGFAAAVVYAEQYRGQEISAMHALLTAGYQPKAADANHTAAGIREEDRQEALALTESVYKTFQTQTTAWQERSVFERQWMLRDFRKHAGMPVEGWRESLEKVLESLREGKPLPSIPLQNLSAYYGHLADLAEGYTKDPEALHENLQHINRWQQEVDQLVQLLRNENNQLAD